MRAINDLFVIFPETVNPEAENLMNRTARVISLPAKKIFVRPGDCVDSILYIRSGRTKHYMISPDGIEKVIYILSRGWFLRESAFVFNHNAARYSITEEPTKLLVIKRELFYSLMQHPVFAMELLRSSSVKNESLRRREESLAFDSGKQRLLKFLISLTDCWAAIDGGWYPLTLQYTHQDMSSIIGVNRVTVSRFITELCDEEKIRVINRKIQVRKDLCKELETV